MNFKKRNNRGAKPPSAVALVLCLVAAVWPAAGVAAAEPAAGSGRFEFYDQRRPTARPIPVWYYRPQDLPSRAPILFVMHGAGRDAERYRDEWQDYAERFHALLLAPEFSAAQFPGRRGYNLGNVASKDGPVRVPKDNAFAVIERIFDDASKRAGLATRRYRIYGHSAGAQFVHRMVLFQPQARIEIAVAANAGWYTMPDFAVDFPYGLKGAAVTPENLRLAFAKKLVIALGDNDTHFDDRSLNRSAAAMQQGAQRLERGGNFFRRAERSAAKLKTPFRWRLVTVPGAGHQNSAMAAALAPLILE